MKYDFSGWATRNNVRCTDGRIIMKDAFRDADGQKVPLVWNHQQDRIGNVLGHAILENREDGVYAYAFSTAGDSFSSMLNGILDTLIRAKDFLTEHIDIGALATVGFGGAFIFLMKKMSDAIGFIAEPFKNISGLIGSIKGVFTRISGVLKAFEKTVKAEMFKKYTEGIRNIAISIAILAGSMIALANVDSNKLVAGGVALAALGTGLTLMSLAFAKFNSATQKISKEGITKTGSGGAGAMLSFVISIKVLLSAMKDIQQMDTKSFIASLGGLVLLGGAFVGAMVVMQKISNASSQVAADAKKGSNASFSMLAFAFSLKTLVKALANLTELDSDTGLSQVLTNATSMFNQGGFDLGSSLTEGLSAASSGMGSTLNGVANGALDLFKGQSSQFNEAGQVNAGEYLGGLQSGSFDLSSVASQLGTENYNELLSNSDLFTEAGELNMEALTKGYQSGSAGTTEFLDGYMSEDISSILSQGSKAFSTGATENMDAYNNTIQSKKDDAVAAMNEVLLAVQNAIVDANTDFSEGASGNMAAFLASFQLNDVDDGGAGQSLVNSFISAVGSSSNTEEATSAFEGIIVTILASIKQSDGDFAAAGVAVVVQFTSGMKSKTGDAKSMGLTVVSEAANGMRSLSFYSVGTDAGQSYINGMNAMRSAVYKAGWNLGYAGLSGAKVALDSHSPSKEFIHLGENAGEGFVIGIDNWISPTAKATSAMMEKSISVAKEGLEAFEEWAEERKFYGELAVAEELAGYEQLQKMYEEGTEERKKIDRQVFTLQKQRVKDTFEYSKKWLEKEEYFDRLTTEDKLAGWKRIMARYQKGTEEYEEAEREAYAASKQLEDERYQERLDHIENEVFYGRMSLSEEITALYELQQKYEVNSEKWQELDKKIYSKRAEYVKDYYDKVNTYISNEKTFLRMGDVDELGTILTYIGQFEEGSDEWKKSMTSAFNLVISMGEAQIQYEKDVAAAEADHAEKRLELEEEYAEKVKSVNKQLEDDIDSLNQKYEDAVKSRADSLYKSYGLFDEIKKKDEVSGDTLIKNLKGQVAEFDEWQSMLQSLEGKGVNKDMIEELQQMGPSSIANVRALNSMTSTQLTQYVNLWATKHRQAREQATGELEDMRVETQNSIAQLKVDAAKELDEYKAIWQKKMTELDANLQKSLDDLTADFHKSIGLLSKYTEEEFSAMAENVSQIMSQKGYNIGTNLILGILKGYEEQKPDLLEHTELIVTGIARCLTKGLDIHSPSRVTHQIGVYAIMGLVNAIEEMTPSVFSASSETAESAKDGFSSIATTMLGLLDGDMDFQPTIRPVLDLTDVSSGMDNLQSMFMAQRSFELANRVSSEPGSNNKLTVRVDNAEVVAAISELRGDMAAMAESISQMQVIMDTGSLVGALAAPMDSTLGRRQVYKGRGN